MSVDQVLVVVGTGTDGASGNMGAHGGMTKVTHRLELACKDAFISPPLPGNY